jgi:hypothetical protein
MHADLPIPARSATLATDLECRRLEHRAKRLERVMVALHDRAVARATGGEVPPPLRQAIAGFGVELGAVRRRLEEMRDRSARDAAPGRSRARANR